MLIIHSYSHTFKIVRQVLVRFKYRSLPEPSMTSQRSKACCCSATLGPAHLVGGQYIMLHNILCIIEFHILCLYVVLYIMFVCCIIYYVCILLIYYVCMLYHILCLYIIHILCMYVVLYIMFVLLYIAFLHYKCMLAIFIFLLCMYFNSNMFCLYTSMYSIHRL